MDAAVGTGAVLQLVQARRELGLDRGVGGVVVATLKLKRVVIEVVELAAATATISRTLPPPPR
jgi:hypothetical protein